MRKLQQADHFTLLLFGLRASYFPRLPVRHNGEEFHIQPVLFTSGQEEVLSMSYSNELCLTLARPYEDAPFIPDHQFTTFPFIVAAAAPTCVKLRLHVANQE